MARFSGPRISAQFFFYDYSSYQRGHLVDLALPSFDLGQLQRRHSHLVQPRLFHRNGDWHQLRLCLDATEVWELVDRCHVACQPQSLCSGHLHTTDPQHWKDGLVHRRIRSGLAPWSSSCSRFTTGENAVNCQNCVRLSLPQQLVQPALWLVLNRELVATVLRSP